MNNIKTLEFLKNRIKAIEEQIHNCNYRIEHSACSNKYESELKKLTSKKQKLFRKIDKLKSNHASTFEGITISINNALYQLGERIRKSSGNLAIKNQDRKIMKMYLGKHGISQDKFSIKVTINNFENQGKEIIADRTISIINKETGTCKTYTAGQSSKTLWYIKFSNDLESGLFNISYKQSLES